MKFNQHYNLEGKHAFLSASRYHWINYDLEKLFNYYSNFMAAAKGTELHAFAANAIRLKEKLAPTDKTLNAYVNDSITFGMKPEVLLYYSDFCWGTADAISFDEKNGLLRIHDLKTGVTPSSMNQLYIYQALFCLEYKYKPKEISSELRIYQNDEVIIDSPDPRIIQDIVKKIIFFDKELNKIRE